MNNKENISEHLQKVCETQKELHEVFANQDNFFNLANDFEEKCGYTKQESREASINVFEYERKN